MNQLKMLCLCLCLTIAQGAFAGAPDGEVAYVGIVEFNDKGLLQAANSCILNNPGERVYPLTVFCNGEVALKIMKEKGKYSPAQWADPLARNYSKIIEIMEKNGFRISNSQAGNFDVMALQSVLFEKSARP